MTITSNGSSATAIQCDAPTTIINLLEKAIGIIQPSGEARIALSDALMHARDMQAWIRELETRGVAAEPSWEAFVHSNGRRKAREKDGS
jgi:hypothetical protein